MQAAARPLEGRHDFAAFQAADGTQRTTEREVFASRLVAEADGPAGPGRTPGRLITYEISGNGFLRHMVRAIAGTLVEVGCGRRGVGVDERGARVARSNAAPARRRPPTGLFLVRVDY